MLKRHNRVVLFVGMLVMLMLTACNDSREAGAQKPSLPEPESIGNPTAGQEIFTSWHGEAPACSSCHTVDGSPSPVGPSLQHIASRAGMQVEGLDAVAYLRQSIVDPEAYRAESATGAQMYQRFDEALTKKEINDLIAYLLTLE